MTIDLKSMKGMQYIICFLFIINTCISFNVFSFMQPISLVVWGLCCLCFVFMLFVFLRQPRISMFETLINCYLIFLITTTIINGTDIKNAIYKSIEVWLLLMLFNNHKENLQTILKACSITLSICVYFNIIVMVLFPNWMFLAKDTFDSFILGGNYNQIGSRLITALIVNIVYSFLNKKWIINVVILVIASITTLALVGSQTSLFGITLFSLLCLIPTSFLKRIVFVFFFSFYLLFQIVVCFSGEGLHNNEYAVYLIRDVMHKDLTFTNRTAMWEAAGNIVAQSPIIGFGWVDRDWYITNMSSFAIGPHNFIYSVLINGGVVLLIIFFILMYMSLKKALSCHDNCSAILALGITTLMFMMTMEVFPFFFVFFLLIIAYYYPNIKELYDKKNVKVKAIETETENANK